MLLSFSIIIRNKTPYNIDKFVLRFRLVQRVQSNAIFCPFHERNANEAVIVSNNLAISKNDGNVTYAYHTNMCLSGWFSVPKWQPPPPKMTMRNIEHVLNGRTQCTRGAENICYIRFSKCLCNFNDFTQFWKWSKFNRFPLFTKRPHFQWISISLFKMNQIDCGIGEINFKNYMIN